jgi:succinate dehydrogenase / fumarate reductase iron-sulfur subunit
LDRRDYIQENMGISYCNITKCCTEVCPEEIHITDNAIIPLKERIVDSRYDPVAWLGRKITRRPPRLKASEALEYTGAAHAQPPAAPGGSGAAPPEPGIGG